MAGELGMQVICEGVENAKQAEMLIELGCYYAQGFYYAKPMPRDVFEGLLEKGKVLQDRKRKQEGSLATEALSPVKAEAISSVDSKKLSVTV